ncbi:MAG: response regulator, partial [Bacteroidales bacterium]|nr:response regulator [Bacteroidales bacterium]
FQKFRQGDESSTRKYGGAGIGLTLVKALTEIMEGRVYFESEPGAGTTFFVELPCLPEDITNKSVGQKYEALMTTEIMVVEDEETNYYLIESIFRKYKTQLIHFTDGETALKYIEEGGRPDIILMDIRLPGIDGLEATRRIKKLNPSIPIIAQTAYAMSGDRERALSAGCDDYLSKPFKRHQLLDLIIQYLH